MERLIPMDRFEQSTSEHALAFTENEAFRQQALIANLWVILFTILVSACLSLPVAGAQWSELATGFAVYFFTNSVALRLAYRGAYRVALLGFTAQVYLSTGFAMILMNEQPAHMVLAMANFVLLHAVVLGRRWALTLTGVMVCLLVLSVFLGDAMAPTFERLAVEGVVSRGLSSYTTLISLLTTACSTGYLIVTTISLHERSRIALVEAHGALETAKRDLQVRHDRARLLSELGASAAAATSFEQLRELAVQAIRDGVDPDDVELHSTPTAPRPGIRIGAGQHGLVITPRRVLIDDDMRFLRTLASLIDGAHTRILAELSIRESKRFEGVGRLAASVAHDFNNLLMPICASYDLLGELERYEEDLKTVTEPGKSASEQARALVEKLLVHARSTEINVELVNFSEVLKSSEMLLRSFASVDVALHLDTPSEPYSVMADKIELQQVLLNLTLNSIAAVGNSGHVSVSLVADADWVILEVSDDGPGIDPELRQWVLEPFNSTTPAGSGLGLATVHRIAQAGGGEVQIGGAPSGGACVRFTLPRIAHSPSVRADISPSVTELPPMRALIVEDDERVRSILAEMLGNLGLTSTTASDGVSALATLESDGQIDLVLSDFQMPGLTGAQLVERMRERGDERPVIMLSGYGTAASDSFKVLPSAMVGKPVSLAELREVLVRVCGA